MLDHKDLRIPGHSYEQGVDAGPDWSHENLADLQANQEGKRHDNRRERPVVLVVCWLGELKVQVCEKG